MADISFTRRSQGICYFSQHQFKSAASNLGFVQYFLGPQFVTRLVNALLLALLYDALYRWRMRLDRQCAVNQTFQGSEDGQEELVRAINLAGSSGALPRSSDRSGA